MAIESSTVRVVGILFQDANSLRMMVLNPDSPQTSKTLVEDENGNMKKVWILASLLTSMLNAFFLGSSIPACVSSGLVTPIHKKGCTLDPANYRPIAVGEPLYRLYIIILNTRLVDWSEKHGLRSPSQAGFRPGRSTIHDLFSPAAQRAAVTLPWEGTPIEGALAWSLRQGDLSAGRSAASGDIRNPPPCSQRNIDISQLKFAEKTSRLMSPFSKDETGQES